MLGRLKFEITDLVKNIVDRLPEDLVINGTIFDPAIAGGQFVREIENRKRAAGKTEQEIRDTVFGMEENILRRDYAVNRNKLVGTYEVGSFLNKDFKDMKFDIIVGNPPYQDDESGNEKSNLYVEFSRKAIESCLKDDGTILFLTPKTLLRKTKRYFSLIGHAGLRAVDFTASSHFNVGVDIVAWELQKGKTFDHVEVKNKDLSITYVDNNDEIADTTDIWLYRLVENMKNNPNKAFKYNNIGPTRSKVKTAEYSYELKQNIKKQSVVYSKKEPYYYGKKKLLISISKGYSIDNCLIDTADYAEAFVCMDLTGVTDVQYNNILSFLFNRVFVALVEKYRIIYKTGFANILVYLPVFNIDKSYTDADVESFFNLTEDDLEKLYA